MSDLDDLLASRDVKPIKEEKIADDGLSAPSPFDFVKSINGKKRMSVEMVERFYDPFMVNQALSQHVETVLFAQEMNRLGHLSKVMQYDFLFATIKKGNRYGKWAKLPIIENVQMIVDIYKVSRVKAMDILTRLSVDNMNDLEKYYDKGGRV